MEKTKQGVLDSFPKLIKGSDKERIAGGVQLVKYLSEQKWVRILSFFSLYKKFFKLILLISVEECTKL